MPTILNHRVIFIPFRSNGVLKQGFLINTLKPDASVTSARTKRLAAWVKTLVQADNGKSVFACRFSGISIIDLRIKKLLHYFILVSLPATTTCSDFGRSFREPRLADCYFCRSWFDCGESNPFNFKYRHRRGRKNGIIGEQKHWQIPAKPIRTQCLCFSWRQRRHHQREMTRKQH